MQHIPIKDIKYLVINFRDKNYSVIGQIRKYIEPPNDDSVSEEQKIKKILRDVTNELCLAPPRPPGYPSKDDEYVVVSDKGCDCEDLFDDERENKCKDPGDWLFCDVPNGGNVFKFGAIKRADVCSICVDFQKR